MGLETLEDRLAPAGFSSLYSFTGSDGNRPDAGVIADSNGNLYGTTYFGGANGAGTVFQYSPSSKTATDLYSFSSSSEYDPASGLIEDSSGNLYGTTAWGGASGGGTAFRLGADSSNFTVLHSFTGSDGGHPCDGSSLIMDSNGNLYGTAPAGGAFGWGTVFELSPDGTGGYNLNDLYDFTAKSDGFNASSTLFMDNKGNLYGTAETGGGSANDGTVFELSPNGGGGYNFATIHTFTGSDGAYPVSNLIMDGNGNLFGTTTIGGSASDGTVFELSPDGTGGYSLTTIHTFTGSDGLQPIGNWLMDSRGNFYGATNLGGSMNDGTVYELSPNGSGGYNLTTLHSFDGSDGSYVNGGLSADSSGNLYGTTQVGGSSNDGTIFEITLGLTLSPATLPGATVGGSYSQTLSAQGGTAPYNFAVTAGSLPAGLTLSSAGLLSGTPTAAGSSSFTVTATDSKGIKGTNDYTLVVGQPAAAFRVTGFPSPTAAGAAGTFTVTAQNADSTTDTGYLGTIHFSSSDPQAVLPPDYTFTTADKGVHTFTAALETAGAQSITATDAANGSVTGSEIDIRVLPGAAASLVFSNVPRSIAAGSAFTLTLTAKDAYGNIATGYTGTVHLSSSDPLAVLPDNYAFTADDQGVHTFTVTLTTVGSQSLTATDTVNDSLTASAAGITITPDNVSTVAAAVSIPFSMAAQTVTLNATVVGSSAPNTTVNEGTVTFTVKDSDAVFGSVVGAVSGGKASADFTLPAGQAAGSYTIAVRYSDSLDNFSDGGDSSAALTITPAKVTATAVNTTIGFSTSGRDVTLAADVSSPAGMVDEGTVTFTLLQDNKVIGTPTTSGIVSNGEAFVSYALPAAALAAGNYTLAVSYSDSKGNLSDNSAAKGTLTVLPAMLNTTAVNASAVFSPSAQSVTLTADLTNIDEPGASVGEGAVTFMIEQGSSILGSARGTVSGSTTSATIALPAGLAAGTYTIAVGYNDDQGNYSDSGDTSASLLLTPANVAVTAASALAIFSPNAQSIALGATVADASILSDTVNEGVVVFTIQQGSANVASVRGMVSDGAASANFAWLAGRPAGSYTIAVSYLDNNLDNFRDSGDTSATLTVAPANVAPAAKSVTVTLPNNQTATLSARIVDTSIPSDSVDAGVVTFTIRNGSTVIGTPVQGTVSGGTASASFALPAGLTAGNYTIAVSYSDSQGNFSDNGDTSASLTISLVPTVTTNPSDQGVYAGQPANFTAAASGNPAPTVQWQLSSDGGNTWADLSGASSTTLVVNDVQAAQNGEEYRAVFTSSLGSATTTAATLVVQHVPTVTTNPTSQSVSASSTAMFTAAANGPPTPTVQWQVSSDGGTTWTNINGATSSTLTLSNVSVSQSGDEYQAVFTNGGGTAITTAATLTVLTPPSVTVNPSNQTIVAGATAIFRAAANGNPAPSVQWQVTSDGGQTWTDINGATSTTLTLSNVPFSQNGNAYRALFSNSAGSVTTSAALLTVQTRSAITSVSSVAFTLGQAGSFTVTATGSPTPTLTEHGILPKGVAFADNGDGTASLAGIPVAGTQGTYHFTIAAHNGIGNDFVQSFILMVSPSPLAPSPPSPGSSTPTSPQQWPALNVPPVLALLGSLLGGFETINANGTETVTDILFVTTLIVSTYDRSGNFVSAAVLGFTIPNWVWYL